MKKLLLIILWLRCVSLLAQYPVTVNTIRTVADVADGTDITATINALVTASVNGDVIVLPKGKFRTTSQINVNKNISIIGQGADSITGTMLYKTSLTAMPELNFFFNFTAPGAAFASYFFVSGIYFREVFSDDIYSSGVGYISVANWMFTDNVIQYANTWNLLCYHADNITGFNGLMFENRILDSYNVEMETWGGLGYGSGAGSASASSWIADPEFGSNKFVFIEDNYFYKTRHAVASSANGKYVFRYNTVRDNWVTSAVDMHGAGAFGNAYSARAAEIYNNDIETTIDSYGVLITPSTIQTHYTDAIGIRGGEALIYSNTVGNYLHNIALSVEVTDDYPVYYQIGYLSGVAYGAGDTGYATDHGNGDVFYWNSIYTAKYPASGWIELHNYDPSLLTANRDFHNVAKPGYAAYEYPHPYRNYYYSFIDDLNSALSLSTSDVGQSFVTLIWTDALMEDGYYIYKSSDNVTFTKEATVGMNVLTAQVTGLNTATQYWFKIVPYNDTHESTASDTETITTIGTPPIDLYGNPVFHNGKPVFKNGKIVYK